MRKPPGWMRVTPVTFVGLVASAYQAGHQPTDPRWWFLIVFFLVPIVWHVVATQR